MLYTVLVDWKIYSQFELEAASQEDAEEKLDKMSVYKLRELCKVDREAENPDYYLYGD